MAVKFNPFTGQLQIDEKGSGGGSSYIDGEVQNFSALPETLGSPAVDSAYLVREAEGTWLLNRKPAGIYVRTANTGTRASDWTYAGEFPDVFNDANLVVYNNTDSTKNVKFDASAITTGTTRTITVPDKNITLDDAGDSRTPSSHASSHAVGGSDPLFDQNLNTTDSVAFANLQITDGLVNFNGIGFEDELRIALEERAFDGDWSINSLSFTDAATTRTNLGLGDAATADIGTGAGDVCAGDDARLSDARTPTSHTHGNLTNDGKIGSTAGLPLKTGTAGVVEAGAFGVNAGEFAEGNHTHADLHTRSHAITSTSDHTAGNHKVFYSNGSGEIVELALGNSGEVLTSNGATSAPSFAAASGVTTGSVDNAILRADGTGGSTSQSSDINIEDATTSTQNNVTISNQHSGQTNSALVLAPKGNGPLLGQKPNGAASGGNSRGNYATDFQRERGINTRVASGNYSVICGGFNNSATNQYAVVGSGDGNQATGSRSVIVTGDSNTASGERSFIGAGNGCTASGAYSAILSGNAAVADRASLHAHANGRFGGVNGSAQRIHGIYFGTTTTNSAVTIVNLSVPASKVIAAIINIVGVKSDGSASAHFVRQYSVKNSGGTTSEVYAAQTIGTDSAASTSVTLSASDADDQLVVECTGIVSETWRWVASVDAVEVSWAT